MKNPPKGGFFMAAETKPIVTARSRRTHRPAGQPRRAIEIEYARFRHHFSDSNR
ncbi:hypothetical protein ACVBGC_06380 [Burkholderia stagnalis]